MPSVNQAAGNGSPEDGRQAVEHHDADDLPLPEFMELEDWDFEEVLSEADRVVRSVRRERSLADAESGGSLRVESAHRIRPATERLRHAQPSEIARPPARDHSISWMVLSLGLAVFVCGAMLVGVAIVQSRTDLWQIGLPMVLGGQLAVLAVVIGQLEAVWQSNRATFLALHAMEQRIGSWQKSADQYASVASESSVKNRPHFRDSSRRAADPLATRERPLR